LVKYVLVVKSIEPDVTKRPDVALRRLKRRHDWMMGHGLDGIDWREAHAEVAKETGRHFVQRYERDGENRDRAVVWKHAAHVPLDYVQSSEDNLRKYLAAAIYRMDLGAVTLGEARNGMVVAIISEGGVSLGKAFKYVRFVKMTSSDMKDMHPHTVRAVHAEVPSWVAHLLPVVKHVIPRKVARRVHAHESLEDMDDALQPYPEVASSSGSSPSSDEKKKSSTETGSETESSSSSSSSSSSNEEMSAVQWAQQREQRYQETVDKLSLD